AFLLPVRREQLIGEPAAVVVVALLALAAEIAGAWLSNGAVSVPSVWGITCFTSSLAVLTGGLLLLFGRSIPAIGGAVAVVIALST
ncbi:hypothetical protein ABTM01_20150, partial [Acinetobacter baumannii]